MFFEFGRFWYFGYVSDWWSGCQFWISGLDLFILEFSLWCCNECRQNFGEVVLMWFVWFDLITLVFDCSGE